MLADANLVADAASWAPSFANLGVTGVVLWWFMTRQEKRSKAMEESVDRCARALTHLLIELEHASDYAKQQADIIKEELEEAKKQRVG